MTECNTCGTSVETPETVPDDAAVCSRSCAEEDVSALRAFRPYTALILNRSMTGQDLTIAAGAVAKTRILSAHSTVKGGK